MTDRRHSPGVILVTGHAGEGCAEPDWTALARSGLTLVIYMGVARCAELQQRLMDAGLDRHTPAQRQAVCELGSLSATLQREGLASPALLVVGAVAARAASDVLASVQAQAGELPQARAAGGALG